MAETLTPQQAQAVGDRGGRLLVSAAAGSGKTKVLVDRLMLYLTDPADPANLDDFLIITYTKAAASELRGKIAAKLTERIAREPENRHLQKQMQRLYLTQISTVHSFCSSLLKEYAYQLDLGADFRVADENECRELREQVLKDLLDAAYENQTESFRAFVDSQGVGRNDGQVPQIIQKVYDAARCHLDPNAWLDSCLSNVSMEGVIDAGQTVWGSFLMKDFFDYLEEQINAMEGCARLAAEIPEYVNVTANLSDTLIQLHALRESKTWDELNHRKEIDYGTLRFPPAKKNPDTELTERIKAVRDACKKGLASKLRAFTDDSAQVLSDLQQSAGAAEGLIELVRGFERDYRAMKRGRRLLDFGDLEHNTLDLLLGKSRGGITAAAREIGRRYREILVDEYQDSNSVQDAIFMALTDERKNCFMVGDVKQSIYQFRLADPGIFLKKYDDFPFVEEAAPGEGRKVLLSHNFRSGAEVISAINDVFSFAMSPRVGGLVYGEAEALREGVPHAPLPDPAVELYALETGEDTYAEEAAFTAEKIRQMLASGTLVREGDSFRPVRPEDIVILLRSPGSVGGEYRRALEARGIRCAIDGGVNLLDTPEVSALYALLQTIANPRQDIPLLATLASPIFGYTADDLAALRSRQKKGYIYDALCSWDSPKAASFRETLEVLRQEARMAPLTQLMEKIYTMTRLDSIYGAMEGGAAKRTNLQLFYQLASDFENASLRSLDQFLDHLEALRENGQLSAGGSKAGCVTIMSIHKSKGLEFPVVFLCNLARRFNQESQREQVLCDQNLGLGLAVVDNEKRIRYSSISKRAIGAAMAASSVSEEMRVLYVAMTRARDRLIMTYAAKKLESELKDIALRLPMDGGRILCSSAGCPGDWILAAAMQRTEAGELHAVSGSPGNTHVGDFPWSIHLVQTAAPETAPRGSEEEIAEAPMDFSREQLTDALAFRYPYVAATQAPSKQTATGRKGRTRDEEASEHTRESGTVHRAWRRPSFREVRRDGKAVGNAFHSAMQFIRYEACGSVEGVRQEITRMTEEGFLTAEESAMVNPERIANFFSGEIGRKLCGGVPCLREFKFSILDNGSHYGEGLEDEQVLLQGVVDCALLEPDGITIVDYKTDHVKPEETDAAAERYRLQLETYADALTRIYEMPVKEKYLYFFHVNQFVKL